MKNYSKVIIVLFVVIIDQAFKYWVNLNIKFDETKNLIPGVISLTKVKNNGAAWSMLEGKTWLFILITLIFIPIAFYFLFIKKNSNISFNIGLSLILGGTIGNFLDRIIYGQVIDMFQLDFINFAIFNIADISINLGVLFLLKYFILDQKDE